jgi:transposase
MAMTIVEDKRAITGGVDTHADAHVAAALDPIGGLLGVQEFPATAAGYAGLPGWLAGFGTVALVGIEGTGSYGAGLARHMAAAGVPVVEAIRALMVAKRSARNERTQAINQARALIVAGPDDLRARFAKHSVAALVAELAALRPRPGDVSGYATRIALRELGRRVQFLDAQLERLDELIVPLAGARAPSLLALHGIGPDTAALPLIAAGTTRSGCAARPPGRTCARSPRSRHHRERSGATGSTRAVTVRPTTPCGGS